MVIPEEHGQNNSHTTEEQKTDITFSVDSITRETLATIFDSVSSC